MSKGYEANKERLASIDLLGKDLGRRAGFVCEWCGSKEELRPQDTAPDREPELESLILLCRDCRSLYQGEARDPETLRHMEGVLWSPEPVVSRSAAALLRRLGAAWAEEIIEMVGIDLDAQ